MGFIKQVLAIAFFAWLLVRIITFVKILRVLGFGVPVFNHNPGPCKLFHVNGSEDIDVLPNGLAIFSSGMHFHLNPMGVDPAMQHYKGIIYTFDLNDPEARPKPITYENFDDSQFVPHGIDIYIDPKTQEVSLFVVNHAAGKHSIEIFQFDQENVMLKHRKTITDEKISSPNDVVAAGPDSFYITNDRYFRNPHLGMIEAFYPLKLGNVVFYDGSQAKHVADGLQFPNGINSDASGRYIFVVNGFTGDVVVFERTEQNDLIERQICGIPRDFGRVVLGDNKYFFFHQRIKTGVVLDNVDVDANGDLWLGVANFLYLDYSANFTRPCPGAVLQVKLSKLEGGDAPFKVDDIREVFSDSGLGEFKCVSSAAFYRGKMLIGNPFSNLVYCDVVAV